MIIDTHIPYTFRILRDNINSLMRIFPFIRREIIGYSVLGNPIYCLIIGNGPKEVFYSGAIHANEWIVSPMLMQFIEDLCVAYISNSYIYGQNARQLLNMTTFFIVPMVNPDGVNLVNGVFSSSSPAYLKAKRISDNYPEIPFTNGWKANLNGVDLNLQFPAGWDMAKQIKYSQGFVSPAPRDFVGFRPLSEPESIAIYHYTLSHNFQLILAYHTQGEEIYWQFEDYAPDNAFGIGTAFANSSGYTLANVPYQSSFAGYKDWFLQEYRKPGYTIESGLGENPLPISQFDKIYSDNIGILVLGAVYA